MIVSVPHTGTRSLQRILGDATIFHFGQNEADFEPIDEPVDFPIRDPLATSLSWRSYQSDRDDMGEFHRWELAIEYLSKHAHTVHKMEDHPVLEGESNPLTWWQQAKLKHDIDALKKLPEVEYLLEWIERPHVKAFFEKHYPEGFWWHRKTATQSS
jgi:hypothetical protein